jgi:hypothetical protein
MNGDVKVTGTQVAEVKKWHFAPKANVPKYASNKTAGYKRAVAGVKEGAGSIDFVWDPSNPLTGTLDVGTAATLTLYINAAQFYSVPAVIESITLDVDLDTGEIVGGNMTFVANGAWTNPVSQLTAEELDALPKDEDGKPIQFVPSGPLYSDGANEPVPVQSGQHAPTPYQRLRADVAKDIFSSGTIQDIAREAVKLAFAEIAGKSPGDPAPEPAHAAADTVPAGSAVDANLAAIHQPPA